MGKLLGGNDLLGGLDPALLLKAGNALSRMNSQPDERCALLTALRPFLRSERQERINEAINILKLLRLAELFRS